MSMLEINTTMSRGSANSYWSGKILTSGLEARNRLDCDLSKSWPSFGVASERWWSLRLLRLLEIVVAGMEETEGVAVGTDGAEVAECEARTEVAFRSGADAREFSGEGSTVCRFRADRSSSTIREDRGLLNCGAKFS